MENEFAREEVASNAENAHSESSDADSEMASDDYDEASDADSEISPDQEDDDHAAVPGSQPEIEWTANVLVADLLLPQLRGLSPLHIGLAIEDDPYGFAPWDLLASHGKQDEGFFFALCSRTKQKHARRSVGDSGAWVHSWCNKGVVRTRLGVLVRWRGVNMTFEAGGEWCSRWVMSEYEITDRRCYARYGDEEADEYWVLCHVRKAIRDLASLRYSMPRTRLPPSDDPSVDARALPCGERWCVVGKPVAHA